MHYPIDFDGRHINDFVVQMEIDPILSKVHLDPKRTNVPVDYYEIRADFEFKYPDIIPKEFQDFLNSKFPIAKLIRNNGHYSAEFIIDLETDFVDDPDKAEQVRVVIDRLKELFEEYASNP